MRQEQNGLIRTFPLFRDVAESHFAELMNGAFLQSFPAGVTLIQEGDMPDFLHIVSAGAVELYARHGKDETAIEIIEPVATFILAAVIRDEVYLQSARTVAPSQILMLPAPAVRSVFGADAAFSRALVAELALRYRTLVRALKNEKLRTSTERLANWIVQEEARQGHKHEVMLKVDKRTLASRLGMTPENFSRNLAHLNKYGIRTAGQRLILDDPEALRRFANPNGLIDDIPGL